MSAVTDTSMKNALIGSSLLHVVVFIFATVGLPFMSVTKPLPEPINTINVEFITIEKETKVEEVKPEPPQDNKPAPAPKMTAEAVPDLSKSKEPEIEEEAPPAEAETVPLPSAPKPPPKSKPPVKKPEPEITKRAAPQNNDEDFNSLLKNLIPDAETTQKVEPEPEVDNSPVANIADRLTISEVDAVRAQLAGCWNVLSGARYAEDLVVAVKLYMNPDRTVRRAIIMDQTRYNQDSFFRAAADAALRALRQPSCSPLRLPEGKYEEWKTTIINFDPRSML